MFIPPEMACRPPDPRGTDNRPPRGCRRRRSATTLRRTRRRGRCRLRGRRTAAPKVHRADQCGEVSRLVPYLLARYRPCPDGRSSVAEGSTAIEGLLAVVAGVVQGDGRADSLELARCGADMAIANLNLAAAVAVAEEVRAMGLWCQAYQPDVSDIECRPQDRGRHPRQDVDVSLTGPFNHTHRSKDTDGPTSRPDRQHALDRQHPGRLRSGPRGSEGRKHRDDEIARARRWSRQHSLCRPVRRSPSSAVAACAAIQDGRAAVIAEAGRLVNTEQWAALAEPLDKRFVLVGRASGPHR
jgi:hypothetical protein